MLGTDGTKNPVKHWFMVQIWRVQQIGNILSLALMAIGDGILIANRMEWRVGNYYITVALLLFLLGGIILMLGWAWDKKAKMWKEQMMVTVERNPYAALKMMPKEIVNFKTIYIPLIELLAKLDTKNAAAHRHNAEMYKMWIADGLAQDPELRTKVKQMYEILRFKET
jgi:hypothetical protein